MAALGDGKSAALLVYLAMTPGPHKREALAELFWPGLPMDVARLKLRQTIFLLRKALIDSTGQSFLVSGRHTLSFDTQGAYTVDALDLHAWMPGADLDAGLAPTADLLIGMSELADLYQQPFLADFVLLDSPGFDKWMRAQRALLQDQALALFAYLADFHESQGRAGLSLPYALRYTELSPRSEAGYLRTIRLYALNGQPEAALRQYETCRRFLEKELDRVPSLQLRGLAERVSSGEFKITPSQLLPLLQPSEDRRHVTVLFCEVAVPDALSDHEVPGQLALLQAQCQRIVQSFQGHVVEYYGGGLLAFFGYPDALENAALSAVRTARALVELSCATVDIRVGVHSGLIVSTDDSHFPDPIGLTTGVAIRLQRQASNADIVISAQTQQRVAGYFRVRPFNDQPGAFCVLEETGVIHRLTAVRPLTPLVGRLREMAVLDQAWFAACGGQPNALLLRGDAGLGKSRLISETITRLDGAPGLIHELRCFPETQHSPLHTLIAFYEQLCGFASTDTVPQKLAKIDLLLTTHAPELLDRGGVLLSRMLGLGANVAGQVGSEQERAATCALLVDLLLSIAGHQPVLLIVEDLQWADASTLEVLALLVARCQAPASLLMLFSARPECNPGWSALEIMSLMPLHGEAMAQLVGSLRADLPAPRVQHIIERAEGVPLFAEELVGLASDAELPHSLQDLIKTRLATLDPGRGVAQLAATLGREFDREVFMRVASHWPVDTVNQALTHLQAVGLMQELPGQRLQFKHALVREAIYQSQSDSVRRAAHRLVAQTLGAHYPLRVQSFPEVLAQHWGAAGDPLPALHYWQVAGKRAAGVFAHREAHAHYEAGLRRVVELADSPQRNTLEFVFLIGLARTRHALDGYGHAGAHECLERAIRLYDQGTAGLGDTDQFNALWALWESTAARRGYKEGSHVALRLLDVAEHAGDNRLLQLAHYALGNSLFWCGELALSRRHLDRSIALEPVGNVHNTRHLTRDYYGRITLVTAQSYSFLLRWLEGWTVKAQADSEALLVLAHQCDEPQSLAFVLTLAALMHCWQGNPQRAQRLAEEGRTLAVTRSLRVLVAVNTSILGWAAVLQGDPQALVYLKRGIDGIRTAASGVAVSLLAPFAEALLHIGHFDQAALIVDEALQQARQNDDFHYFAELHRLKGLCQVRQGDITAALSSFDRAIAISQRQGSRPFEVRARTSRTQLKQ